MTKLIPLADIPTTTARNTERQARKQFANRAAALVAANVRILVAPGCHGEPFPPVVGYVLTEHAARAIAAQPTRMPGGSVHHRRTWDRI